MKCIAIIPARSGSKGLPDKNIANVCGRPLMDYTIKAALKSKCFDTVMVSTDSEKYAQISRECGAEVPFLRSAELSRDTAGSWDAVREVLEKYKENGKNFDYVMLLQPTSPLRTENDINEAIEFVNAGATNVVSVTEVAHPVQWCFPLDATKSMSNYAVSPYNQMRRQDLQKYYQENGAIYFVSAEKIEDPKYNLYADNCMALIMPRSRSIDIDEKTDLIILKAILSEEIYK